MVIDVIEPHTTMETHGSKSLQDTLNCQPQQQGVHDMKFPNLKPNGPSALIVTHIVS